MRWWTVIALVLLIAVPHAWSWSLLHILLCLSLALILQNDPQKIWRDCLKSWRILRWILLPTILLHSLFTPGEIIWLNSILPISYEGLNLGLRLSLHLSEMFVAALLLGYLLPIKAWLELMTMNPIMKHYFYPYLSPYIRLMPMMMRGVRILVRRTYAAWSKETSKLSLFPLYMKNLLHDVSKYSHRRARYVWDTWDTAKYSVPEKEGAMEQQRISYTFYIVSIYIAVEIFIRYLWG